MKVGGLNRKTSLRGLQKSLESLSAFPERCAPSYMLTIVDHDGCLAVAARKAFLIYGLEALERGLADAPDLCRWRFGRVAARRQRNVCCCRGCHRDGSVVVVRRCCRKGYDMSQRLQRRTV